MRVEFSRVNDGDTPLAAPSSEGDHPAPGGRASEASHVELRNRRSGIHCTLQPRTSFTKAGDVHFPAPPIETPNQLDHLVLGSAGIEARHHDGEWNATFRPHAWGRSLSLLPGR